MAIKPDEARKQLSEWRVADTSDLFQSRPGLKKLTTRLQHIAMGIANQVPEELEGDEKDHIWIRKQKQAFAKLKQTEQSKIIKVIFGNLAREVELACKWLAEDRNSHLQNGFRSPFRYPRSANARNLAKLQFVSNLARLIIRFDSKVVDVEWLVVWSTWIDSWERKDVDQLFAAVVDKGGKLGDRVFEILRACVLKDHPIGGMSDHVIGALLMSQRVEGYELIEKLFLAAQRQEGLRQSILSAVVTGTPVAFRRIVELIVENNLTRYSSVVQAFDQWLGMRWTSMAKSKIDQSFFNLVGLLSDDSKIKATIEGYEPESTYLALFASAIRDATTSVRYCKSLLERDEVELRFVAVNHLANLPPLDEAVKLRVAAIRDVDLNVAVTALLGPASEYRYTSITRLKDDDAIKFPANVAFDNTAELLNRIPARKIDLKACVWPWTERKVQISEIGSQLGGLASNTDVKKMIPWIQFLKTWDRRGVIQRICESEEWDVDCRTLILDSVGDSSAEVRAVAIDAILKKEQVTNEEAEQLYPLLKRTPADLRVGVVSILANVSDQQAFESAEVLLNSGNKSQRLGGLELLRQLFEADRESERCRVLAENYQRSAKRQSREEKGQLEVLLAPRRKQYSLDDALGLMDPAKCSPVVAPKKKKIKAYTSAAFKLIENLDKFIHQHRTDEVSYSEWLGRTTTAMLGEIRYGFPVPDINKPIKQQADKFPLRKTFQDWYKNRPASCQDGDGLELIRANVLLRMNFSYEGPELRKWAKKSAKNRSVAAFICGSTLKEPKIRYPIVSQVMTWLLWLNWPKNGLDAALDVSETIFSMIPREEVEALTGETKVIEQNWSRRIDDGFRMLGMLTRWVDLTSGWMGRADARATKGHRNRLWNLLHWFDQPLPEARRCRPQMGQVVEAWLAGAANSTDVVDQVLGPRDLAAENHWGRFSSLQQLFSRKPEGKIAEFRKRKAIEELVQQIADRLLEIELERGEAPTVSTEAALKVNFRGADTLMRILVALGEKPFKKLSRWGSYTSDNRQATFTALAENTYPRAEEDRKTFSRSFKAAIKEGKFPEERLVQLAFLAPQWAEFIEPTIGWKGFTEAIYWFMAHMKYVWGVEDAFATEEELENESKSDDAETGVERLSRWEQIIRERTPLTAQDRQEGAIDVGWFQRTYQEITPKRWEAMTSAARYAATSAQAKRAQFVADTLLGITPRKSLVDGIKKRNLKENVRLLGLLPLAGRGKSKESAQRKDLYERFEILQAYLKYARGLSSMSRPEAIRAYEIGIQNLAATAGFADATRLQWAMEAEGTRDLAEGPLVAEKGEVSLTLSLDEYFQPELVVRRGEKVLKSLPSTVKKDKKFVALRERHKHLKQQASRTKLSLEQAMCRGDEITGGELAELSDHAIVWPQIERLVLVGDGLCGYPARHGKALVDFAGKLTAVKKNEKLRIAHPIDLLKSKAWSKWQRECFNSERIQPFKQVFRELYVVTADEKKNKFASMRYAGHQLNRRQAFALWGSRGWSVDEYENVWKSFHNRKINVSVSFDFGETTPLEVEGLTLDQVNFCESFSYKPIKIIDVDPKLFSEVMRDIDLVVSVAHVGEVDPEASASTIELRLQLVGETCQLLNLNNVSVKKDRVLIKGALGDYSIHAGSGVVHRMPGGSVCLVPVHSQHRGRLFLPFADNDPRTAELVSKTILLAKDDQIDDPILLDQLRR